MHIGERGRKGHIREKEGRDRGEGEGGGGGGGGSPELNSNGGGGGGGAYREGAKERAGDGLVEVVRSRVWERKRSNVWREKRKTEFGDVEKRKRRLGEATTMKVVKEGAFVFLATLKATAFITSNLFLLTKF